MAIKIPNNADIKRIEFELKRSEVGDFYDELNKCEIIELNNSSYAVKYANFEQQERFSGSIFEIPQEPKVKISIELYKLKGENNE